MTPKLSIVIVNYRSADRLRVCLQSLFVATDQPLEVILVDNSLDDGAEAVAAQSGLKVHYFPMSANRGYTVAANFGAQHAVGEVLCFLNPDMVLEARALDRLIEWVEQHPRTVAGPRERNDQGQIMTTAFPAITRRHIWGAHFLYKFPWPISWRPWLSWLVPAFQYTAACRTASAPFTVPVLSGSMVVMRHEVWQDVGDWNPDLTFFGLEAEWFSRAASLGVVAWYIPGATVIHEHGVSIRRADGWEVHDIADANRRWHARRIGLVTFGVLLLVLWVERAFRRRA